MSEDTEEIRRRIDQKHAEIQDATYYEILDVDSDAASKEISKRFRNLAKKWHADRFSGRDLDERTTEKLQEIFSAINDAHRTLTDEEARQEYDASLEHDPNEISSVIDAESAFRRGRSLLDAGRNEGAHRHFRNAVEMSPEEEPEYRAHLLYTEYLLIDKDDEGAPLDRERAREIFEDLEAIESKFQNPKPWIYAHMGVVALGIDRNGEAKRLFRETLSHDSNNRLAQRQLRLMRMRSERENNQGFFSKILSKLNLA